MKTASADSKLSNYSSPAGIHEKWVDKPGGRHRASLFFSMGRPGWEPARRTRWLWRSELGRLAPSAIAREKKIFVRPGRRTGMSRLDGISMDFLRDGLGKVRGKRATMRLVVAINYKAGVAQTELADWYGVSRTTIHNWLRRIERLESEPLADVVYDDDRPGRPPKLDESQRARLREALSEPPARAGLDEASWFPELVRTFVRREFGVDYTRRHARTLLEEIST